MTRVREPRIRETGLRAESRVASYENKKLSDESNHCVAAFSVIIFSAPISLLFEHRNSAFDILVTRNSVFKFFDSLYSPLRAKLALLEKGLTPDPVFRANMKLPRHSLKLEYHAFWLP